MLHQLLRWLRGASNTPHPPTKSTEGRIKHPTTPETIGGARATIATSGGAPRVAAKEAGRAGVCRRHPRACGQFARPVGPTAPVNGTDAELGPLPTPTAAGALASHPALAVAMKALGMLAGTWCLERDGCIASTWRAASLPQPQRHWLLHAVTGHFDAAATGAPAAGSRALGSGCFDESRPPSGQYSVERCPTDRPARRASGTAAASPTPSSSRAKLSPLFLGEFGFELLRVSQFKP
jgi:hypothetical protein